MIGRLDPTVPERRPSPMVPEKRRRRDLAAPSIGRMSVHHRCVGFHEWLFGRRVLVECSCGWRADGDGGMAKYADMFATHVSRMEGTRVASLAHEVIDSRWEHQVGDGTSHTVVGTAALVELELAVEDALPMGGAK